MRLRMHSEHRSGPPFSPRTWLSWIALGVLVVFAQMPAFLGRMLGAAMGALMYVAAPRRRRIAARNLELAFPELDASAQRNLLWRNLLSTGIGGYEFIRAWWGPLGGLPKASRISGVEHLQAARAAGRGVILLSGHFLTLELCGRLLCEHVPVGGMYREHGDTVFEWAVKRGRLRYAQAMFTRDELRASVRHLKAGNILWYAPDQDMRGKDTVFVPFFGVSASTITATHALARMSGAAVIGFFHRRRDDGYGYEMRIEAPLDAFPSADPVADAARVNALIERMVREAPDEYLWVHRRFHRRPPGEPRVY
jgi:Kdo2-lipid IVA lauroyltransferase/acyltransferase